jgi:hypothetical protein
MDGSTKQDRFFRIEQKYLFPAGYEEVLRSWLEHACVPDPLYPSDTVSSIYFDTPELSHYHESRNGEFLRSKVRLRWYADPEDANLRTNPDGEVRCFLEVKAKQGALSGKTRREVWIPLQDFCDPFSAGRILELAAAVCELGYHPPGLLLPLLMVRYRRLRYLDIAGDGAIALDTDIRCTGVNQAVIQGSAPVQLSVGVLEAKRMSRQIPKVLEPITGYLRKSPFTKYGIALESLMQPLGRRV